MHIPNIAFREQQLESLAAFVESGETNIFIQGYNGTGKTFTLNRFFHANPDLVHAFVNPIELVSCKPLIQSTARAVQHALRLKFPEVVVPDLDPLQVEETYYLVNYLDTLFKIYQKSLNSLEDSNVYVILDGLDLLQDIDATVLLKFIKLNELLQSKKLRLIYTIQDTFFIQKYAGYAIPTVVFSRYTQEQLISILISMNYNTLITTLPETLDIETKNSIVVDFIQLILQAFHSYTGNDLDALNDLIDLKWDSYITNIDVTNSYDSVALYKKSIKLFTTTDDTFTDDNDTESQTDNNTYELSTIAKYLLIAAYFCSYLEQKYDSSIFSRKSHIKAGRAAYGRRKKRETNPRHLQPSLFLTERLLAIFQAIYPAELDYQSGSLSSLLNEPLIRANTEVFQNIAELNSLKLLSTTVGRTMDYLNYKLKWKVNVPWEIIKEIAKSVDFDIGQYFSGVSD